MANKPSDYKATVGCDNCGIKGDQSIPRGLKVKEAECNNCGVKSLKLANQMGIFSGTNPFPYYPINTPKDSFPLHPTWTNVMTDPNVMYLCAKTEDTTSAAL